MYNEVLKSLFLFGAFSGPATSGQTLKFTSWPDGWTDGRADGRTDGRRDEWTG